MLYAESVEESANVLVKVQAATIVLREMYHARLLQRHFTSETATRLSNLDG